MAVLPERKSFLVRLDPELLDALRRWADDDLRSMNGQLEFILRKALRDANRDVTKEEKAGQRPEAKRRRSS